VADAWQILHDAGLPMARSRTCVSHDAAAIAGAIREVMPAASGRDAEALAAFILAWRSHWPTSFASALGEAVVAWAEGHAIDRGRYIKLRRIAIANLAHVL